MKVRWASTLGVPRVSSASGLRSSPGLLAGLLLPLLVVPVSGRAETEAPGPVTPPQLTVSGFGLLQNRTLRKSLLELQPDKTADVFDANFIEDAFLLLHNQLLDEGFLRPLVVGNLVQTNGQELAVWWDGAEELNVPTDLAVMSAHFEVIRGVLFYYDELAFEGLSALSTVEAQRFFVTQDALLNLKTARRFSADGLQSSMRRLRRELLNRGYRDAMVKMGKQTVERETGRVRVTVLVEEGSRYVVRSLKVRLSEGAGLEPVTAPQLDAAQPYSMAWEQDTAQALKVQLYQQGYADALAHVREVGRAESDGEIAIDVAVELVPGERVALGEVRFEGAEHTREAFLKRRAKLAGPWLDRVAADRTRERLARFGIFRFVGLRLEPDTGSPRDVLYELEEGKRFELSVLAGYGSYDQFFGGVDIEHLNLWGVGHNTRLKLVQSVRSSHGTYTYTVPEFLAPHLNLFAAADGFRREELTFDRQELKLSIGLQKQFPRSRHQLGLRYSYEFLDAQTAAVGDEVTRAAAVIADWSWDHRDNPLLPRAGYRLYANSEVADQVLGGESEYVRLEIGAAYHHPFARGLVAHLGLLHSVAISPDSATLLPFNKRFFPGGENSVRGYQRGGASPLNAAGDQIGAESVLQWNLELEQNLTRTISIVGFLDGAGITPKIESWPFDEALWSVGAGVRWNTIIGPVRLEYGHNLNPREADPNGTLHFSIGFPF
jgi:outer membrane protein assembly complex protein YaeT